MKLFRVHTLIPDGDDKHIRIEAFYAASHITRVLDRLKIDFNDEATCVESIAEVAPSVEVLNEPSQESN